MKHTFFLLSALGALLFTSSCNKDDDDSESQQPGSMRLMMENTVLDENDVRQTLTLNTMLGVTEEGDTISVSELKYYLSNFVLVDGDGGEFPIPDSYLFFGQFSGNASASRMVSFDAIPAGTYTNLKFAVGIDVNANRITPLEVGDLDPFGSNSTLGSNNMIWTWSTGYKFVKLEGSTNGDDGAVGQAFVYHIANPTSYNVGTDGINGPAYKIIDLPLSTPVRIGGEADPMVHVILKLEEFWDGPNVIDVETQFNPGHGGGATIFAQNYAADFFEVHHIEN